MGLEKKWFAIYTAPRAEKQVAIRLEQLGIENYLPLQKVLKQWSDRRKWVEEPLFRSYLFVKVNESHYYSVLNTLGVVKFIHFGGQAQSIPDFQIETIRRLLMDSTELEVSHRQLAPGTPVEVIAGPLMGTLAELVSMRGESRLAIKILSLDVAVLVNIAGNLIEPITDKHKLELVESLRTPKFIGRQRELG
jgi:transcriptional antiterminator RfaH